MASEERVHVESDDTEAVAQPFEVLLERLEQIVRQLERGETSLEESLKLFEEGVLLSRQCAKRLDRIQGRVEILLEEAEQGRIVQPFEGTGEAEVRGGDR